MKKQALVLRHVAFEDLGTLEKVLQDADYSIQYREVGYDCLDDITNDSCELLIILGGPIGVFETENYPFISQELNIIKTRVAAALPTLGICLGAQMIAGVCGAQVYSADQKEIGWSTLTLKYSAQESYFAYLENVSVLHWHRDTFTKPDDPKFKILASTPQCQHQAFTYGDSILGLQFHCEVDVRSMEKWLIGHAHEISCLTDGTTLLSLRRDAAKYSAATQEAAKRFFKDWLNKIK